MSKMVTNTLKGVIFSLLVLQTTQAKVLELSDRFLQLKDEGIWLIKFYAPWCGHCKKLEPVWKHVEQSLNNVPVRVGRIDCTRFPAVAQEFNIVGYPTILLLKGKLKYAFEGERSREDIVAFAKRLLGPPVSQLRTRGDFEEAQMKSELFFVFSGEEAGPLWDSFIKLATKYQQHEFFYHVTAELGEKISGEKETQTIRVYKDGTSYKFDDADPENLDRSNRSPEGDGNDSEQNLPAEVSEQKNTTVTLTHWLSRERFSKFIRVTRSQFSHLLGTKKLLVLAVLEENRIGEMTAEMEDFRKLVSIVVEKNFDRYRDHYQFGWTPTSELANSIAMETLSLPHLLVINASSYQHYLPDDDPREMTAEAIAMFLDDILMGGAPVYGGSSYTVRLYRAYYELKTSVTDMWAGNPALTAVLLGLPTGFFALICYSICCANIMDAEDDEDEREDDLDDWHEKTD